MKRRAKLAVLAGVLLAAMCVAAPRSAQAGGWSFSFYSGAPGYGYGGGYGGGYGHGHGCARPVFVPPPPPPCYRPAYPVYRYRAYSVPYGAYGYRGGWGW